MTYQEIFYIRKDIINSSEKQSKFRGVLVIQGKYNSFIYAIVVHSLMMLVFVFSINQANVFYEKQEPYFPTKIVKENKFKWD